MMMVPANEFWCEEFAAVTAPARLTGIATEDSLLRNGLRYHEHGKSKLSTACCSFPEAFYSACTAHNHPCLPQISHLDQNRSAAGLRGPGKSEKTLATGPGLIAQSVA